MGLVTFRRGPRIMRLRCYTALSEKWCTGTKRSRDLWPATAGVISHQWNLNWVHIFKARIQEVTGCFSLCVVSGKALVERILWCLHPLLLQLLLQLWQSHVGVLFLQARHVGLLIGGERCLHPSFRVVVLVLRPRAGDRQSSRWGDVPIKWKNDKTRSTWEQRWRLLLFSPPRFLHREQLCLRSLPVESPGGSFLWE